MTFVKIGNVYVDTTTRLTEMLQRDLESLGYTIVHEPENSNFDIVFDVDRFKQPRNEIPMPDNVEEVEDNTDAN